MKIAIVTSEFNANITQPMLEKAEYALRDLGVEPLSYKVPGALEIPYAIQEIIMREKPDAFIALGCIIKGETDHYDAIMNMVSAGVMDLTIKHHVPIIFEVLMCDTYQKAEARIEKGAHAAEAAVRMVKFKQNDELLASASV